jgi:hypothetical protein
MVFYLLINLLMSRHLIMTWLVTKLFAWEGRRVRAVMLHAMIMLCSMDSCRDVPQYTVMKYHVFGVISSSLLF